MFEAHHSPLLPDESDATAIFGPQKGMTKFPPCHVVPWENLWGIHPSPGRHQWRNLRGEGLVLKLRVFPICITPAMLRLPLDPYYQHRWKESWKLQAQQDLFSTLLSWANCNPNAHSMRFVWVSIPTKWLSLFPQLLHLPVMNIAPWVIWICPWVMLKKQNEHTLPVESFSKVPVPQSFQELWFQTTPWRGCSFNS